METKHLATSLFKALDVLTLVSSKSPSGVLIAEVIDGMSLPRSSLIRILDSLIHYGLVERLPDRRYAVTTKFYDWKAEDAGAQLKRHFDPLMKKITNEVGEMTVLGRLVGRRIEHIHCVEPEIRVRVIPPVGRNFQLHTMAMGKLALTVRPDLIPDEVSPRLKKEINAATKEGHAWNRGDSENGIIAWGTWLGEPSPLTPMIAVTWPDFRFSEKALRQVKKVLRESLK
ncbi:helix-turn-helix domain-containing protein [Opitutia bacterium ISCC 51]|nr:helix-turn-helix domain-containing protein [Opitutae bacterium ISCC 51]QXD29853.1 helix-turn-helix domain-containing protein [Opitutae bacterium ISCC 52]